MRTWIIGLLLAGCIGSLPPVGSSQDCARLRTSYKVWGAVSVASAATAGGGALVTAIPDGQDARLIFGSASVVVAVLSAVGVYLRDLDRAEYDAVCKEVVK